MVDQHLIKRMERVRKKLEMIKRALKDRNVNLGGRLKGTKFEEDEFEEAKASLFKSA